VNIVHQFARELRPAVRTRLTAFSGVEQLDTAKRTVLYRVAQEAMTNVAHHAKASRVEVSIQKLPNCICMRVKDDGRSFRVERVMHSRSRKHLGLLGMRERLEMIGGRLGIESVAGRGTAIEAKIPFPNGGVRGGR
jgi:signal transduction histidine kinase